MKGSPDHMTLRPGVILDLALQGMWKGRRFIPLPSIPFRLLTYLAQHPNAVISESQLLAVGWPGEGRDPLDLYRQIYRIRHFIEPHPDHPRWLITHRNAGYWLRIRGPTHTP